MALTEQAVLADAASWLGPLLTADWMSWNLGELPEALQPLVMRPGGHLKSSLRQLTSPAGTAHAIDYDDPGGPSVELRVQALFGLNRHPTFGQPVQPLLLKLARYPGGKPAQPPRFAAFWRGSWRDVVKDLKGRYPNTTGQTSRGTEFASLKTKNAFNRT